MCTVSYGAQPVKIVVTLAEGSYFQGACVLFNSLVANGFSGIFVAGCRSLDSVPISERSAIEAFRSTSVANCSARWEWFCVETTWHFTNYKPRFMQQILEAYPECSSIVYLDPDIIACAPWHWIDSATQYGPVVAGDVNWCLPSGHPARQIWTIMMEKLGISCQQRLDLYFNGGLLGIQRRDSAFLTLWLQLIEEYGSITNPLDAKGDIGAWRHGGRWDAMHAPDQDALNMAAMAWPQRLSTFGPDLMGFSGGWIGLPHALGSAKPWRRHYLREALAGRPPTHADKIYWMQPNWPIVIYPRLKTRIKQIDLSIASFIGRFYRRA